MKPIFNKRKISKRSWNKRQIKDELGFWDNPSKFESLDGFSNHRDRYFHINKNMFTNIKLDFDGKTIVDVGCGPEYGFLPFAKAKYKIGIDPLAFEYRKKYPEDKDIIMLNSPSEDLPLTEESVDALFCINALDHMYKPYLALEEMYRVLKKGAYFSLSVDIGGTPCHPIKILKKDIDNFIDKHNFEILERCYGTDRKSSNANVPLYVFQAIKK